MNPSRAVSATALLALVACADLPHIGAQQCGNGVVEPPETCDTFGPDVSSSCRPPGTVGACHLDCRRRADGTQSTCPPGWGCDVQGICLKPTAGFTLMPEIEVGGAHSLVAGDFDGDGRTDIVSREPIDALGRTRLRVHYFGPDGLLQVTRDFPKPVASPAILDLSGDGRSDLVFTDSRVGVLLGQANRSLVPETFSSYRFHDARVRIVSVLEDWLINIAPVASLTSIDGRAGFYVPDPTGPVRHAGGPPVVVDDLSSALLTGDVIEDPRLSPCHEIVFAGRHATSFWLVDPCTRMANGTIVWREAMEWWTVALEPPAVIEGTPLLADMNGDHHLDVLLDAGGRRYVSYGDGARLAPARPYALEVGGMPALREIPMPLAAGDFTGDGAVDFVFADHLLVSWPPEAPGALLSYHAIQPNRTVPWTVARIADLNADGRPDVAAASDSWLGVSFFNGTGDRWLTGFVIPTEQPVRLLEVADLDGDLVNDLAIVERPPPGDERDTITVAFGNLAGPPARPVPTARVRQIEQVSQFTAAKLGSLMVCSTESVEGRKDGVAAWLEGSGDRVPFSPYQLVSASNGSVLSAAALAVTVGQFVIPGRRDVLALATDGDPAAFDNHFWLLPSLLDRGNAAVRLGGSLDRRLRPIIASDVRVRVQAAAASADFDRDGRDEAVWAMPADEDQSCGLVFTALRSDGSLGVSAGGTIFVDHPCAAPQIATVDADSDGAPDVVLLTGGSDNGERQILVLWNDGQGGFSASRATRVNAAGETPRQFTVLPPSPHLPLSIAYVTPNGARLATITAVPRLFGPSHTIAPLNDGTGIVAGDVDGDGVIDLALAAAGNVRVLRAELESP